MKKINDRITEFDLNNDEGDIRLAANFKVKEFACKDGSNVVLIDSALVEILQKMRIFLKRPIIITSGYRTESYNKKVNGAKDSYHCKGMAADIRVDGIDNSMLSCCAMLCGATGIGIYKDFIHVDTRDDYTLWEN